MTFAEYLDNPKRPLLYKVYLEGQHQPLSPRDYQLYRNYHLEIIRDDDYDDEGNNWGVVWGYLTKPSLIL